MGLEIETILLYAGGALGLLFLAGIRGQPDHEAPTPPDWRTTVWAVFAFLVLFAISREASPFMVGGDEYFRLYQSFAWAEAPFFAGEDHVFLAGQFYVLGSLYLVFGHMELMVVLTSLLGVGLTIHFAIRLAFRMWNHQSAALFAGLLAGSQWIVLWSSTNPMAEVFFWPALLAALDSWLTGWQARGGDSHNKAHVHFLRAAAWVAFGTMFRYEMWYAGMALGAFLGIRAVVLLVDRDPRDRQEGLACLLSCAVIAAYPLAWMISSSAQLGSLTGFLDAAIQQHNLINPPPDEPSRLTQFFTYPSMLLQDNGTIMGLAAVGILAALMVAQRSALPQVVAVICIALMAMLVSIRTGIGSRTPERLTVFLALPLFCVAAGPLALIWGTSQPALRKPFRILVGAFLVLVMVTSAAKARLEYPHASRVHPEFLALMNRLEREGDQSRRDEEYPRIRMPDKDLGIFHGPHFLNLWMIAYHSGAPERIIPIPDVESLERFFDEADPDTHVLVRELDLQFAVPAHVTLVEEMALYELWRVGDRTETPR